MKQKHGFTLIELLVVIAIIGILAAIGTSAFSGAQMKARDAKRVADTEAILKNLTVYVNAQEISYPVSATAAVASTALSAASTAGRFAIPRTPSGAGGANDYWYITSADGSIAAIFTRLEKNVWYVMNSKGFANNITPSNPSATPPLPNAANRTFCSAADAGAGTFQPCLVSPKFDEGAGTGGGSSCPGTVTSEQCDAWRCDYDATNCICTDPGTGNPATGSCE